MQLNWESKIIFAVIVSTVLVVGNARADDDDEDIESIPRIPIYSETHKLEDILQSHPERTDDANRLAEIYFLTSRCNDASRVAPKSSEIKCACGGKCSKSLEIAKIEDFRKLLLSSPSWSKRSVVSLWKAVKDSPEAQYFATSYLRQNPIALETPSHQGLRSNLEAALDSLEVRTIVE